MRWRSSAAPAAMILALSGLAAAQEKPAAAQGQPAAQQQQQPQAPEQPSVVLKPGDSAPAFSMAGSDGRTHTLADHAGKEAVVIAWFPKAFTGG